MMKEQVLQIVREIEAKLDQKELKKSGIFVYPNIPPDASTRAVNRFGAGITEDDVLVLANTAAFKSGNEGLIISAEALYSSELEATPAQHIKFCLGSRFLSVVLHMLDPQVPIIILIGLFGNAF